MSTVIDSKFDLIPHCEARSGEPLANHEPPLEGRNGPDLPARLQLFDAYADLREQ